MFLKEEKEYYFLPYCYLNTGTTAILPFLIVSGGNTVLRVDGCSVSLAHVRMTVQEI